MANSVSVEVRPRRRAALALIVALAVVTTGRAATMPPRPTILIQNFDLFDTSIDHRAVVIADQKRWLAAASAQIRHDLAGGSQFTVIDSSASQAMTAAIGRTYQHPSTCRSCAIAEARKLGARYVFIGSVHKVSDLIIYMRGELDEVGDGTPIMVKSMEVKADNGTMILRGATAMADAIEARMPQSH